MPSGAAAPQPTVRLDARQLEIVSAIVAGSTNHDIAKQFSISSKTVKYHLTKMFDQARRVEPHRAGALRGPAPARPDLVPALKRSLPPGTPRAARPAAGLSPMRPSSHAAGPSNHSRPLPWPLCLALSTCIRCRMFPSFSCAGSSRDAPVRQHRWGMGHDRPGQHHYRPDRRRPRDLSRGPAQAARERSEAVAWSAKPANGRDADQAGARAPARHRCCSTLRMPLTPGLEALREISRLDAAASAR